MSTDVCVPPTEYSIDPPKTKVYVIKNINNRTQDDAWELLLKREPQLSKARLVSHGTTAAYFWWRFPV